MQLVLGKLHDYLPHPVGGPYAGAVCCEGMGWYAGKFLGMPGLPGTSLSGMLFFRHGSDLGGCVALYHQSTNHIAKPTPTTTAATTGEIY